MLEIETKLIFHTILNHQTRLGIDHLINPNEIYIA